MSQQLVTALAALLIAVVILVLGRRDVSRPAVAFGVPWFGFLALAQLRLTELEGPWSTGFTLTAFGGGLVFVVAATLAGGTAPARGTLRVPRDRIDVRRVMIAAVVLILGGIVAALYRAHLYGAVPLFAANPDAVRARGFLDGVPAWSSALLGGFYIGMWATLVAIWALSPRVSRLRLVPLWLLAGAALIGVALEASRNLVVFALVVPAVGAYVLTSARGRRRQLAWVAGAVCVLVVGVGGLFLLRVSRGDDGAHGYISQELDRQPPIARPLLPLYVNAVFPLEAARRVYAAVPGRIPYDDGAASLMSLPDKLFPEGKSQYPKHVVDLMSDPSATGISWAVASYQGRLLEDLGWQGVLFGSALIGLAFGSLYRWARGRAGFLAVGVIGYVAYYSAYMVYDNHLSFSVISLYDLTLIALVGAYCLHWTDSAVAALKQLGRGLVADREPS